LININIVRINCTPNWFYLKDNAEMQGQQNTKFSNAKQTSTVTEQNPATVNKVIQSHSATLCNDRPIMNSSS
jgi:hypothetical protein